MSSEFPGISLKVIDIEDIRSRTFPPNLKAINWLLLMASNEGVNGNTIKRSSYLRPIRELSNIKLSLADLSVAELRQFDGVGDTISNGIYNIYHS